MAKPHQVTFRELADKIARQNRADTEPPIPYTKLAERCRISRQYFHRLLSGAQVPSPWIIHRIAAGFRVPADEVAAALAQTYQETQ